MNQFNYKNLIEQSKHILFPLLSGIGREKNLMISKGALHDITVFGNGPNKRNYLHG